MMKTYMDIALDDYARVHRNFEAGDSNACLRYCEQFVEKALKHIIDKNLNSDRVAEDKELLSSHRVAQLARRVEEILGVEYSKEDYRVFRNLQSYYYDLSYPSDRYEDVDIEEAKYVVDWLEGFKERICQHQQLQLNSQAEQAKAQAESSE